MAKKKDHIMAKKNRDHHGKKQPHIKYKLNNKNLDKYI
jgi:hypothetical protein